jgi:hypothetical protein
MDLDLITRLQIRLLLFVSLSTKIQRNEIDKDLNKGKKVQKKRTVVNPIKEIWSKED